MLPAAVGTAVALLALLIAVPRLAAARWPCRAPVPALLLWQALGLAGGLLALEAAAAVALAPLGATYAPALSALPAPLPWWAAAAALVGVAALARLLTVLATSTARTVRARHRHRVLVDLVATRNPLLRETAVVDHDVPVAYCLPGLRPRVVVSRGVLTALGEDELRAVLEHELAHVVQRHDLVVLPFTALRATFPWLRPASRAQEQVTRLVEMLADDRAVRRHDRAVLARALCKVGARAAPPDGGLGAGTAVLERAQRLLEPPAPLPRATVVLVLVTAGVVALLPAAGLLLPRWV